MIDPDLRRRFNINEVLALGCSIKLQVANNDIGDVLDVQTDTLEFGRRVNTEDGLVAGWAGLNVSFQSALDVDDSRSVGRNRFGESS